MKRIEKLKLLKSTMYDVIGRGICTFSSFKPFYDIKKEDESGLEKAFKPVQNSKKPYIDNCYEFYELLVTSIIGCKKGWVR